MYILPVLYLYTHVYLQTAFCKSPATGKMCVTLKKKNMDLSFSKKVGVKEEKKKEKCRKIIIKQGKLTVLYIIM